MKLRILFILSLVFLVSVAVIGCGDEDDDNNTPDATEEVAEEVTEEVAEEVVEMVDMCTSDADMAIIGGGTVDVTAEATTCGMGCLSDADPGTCSVTCLTGSTGVSDGCAGCYAASVVCTIDKCVGQCAIDPASEECMTCRTENGCISDFFACSGLTPTK